MSLIGLGIFLIVIGLVLKFAVAGFAALGFAILAVGVVVALYAALAGSGPRRRF